MTRKCIIAIRHKPQKPQRDTRIIKRSIPIDTGMSLEDIENLIPPGVHNSDIFFDFGREDYGHGDLAYKYEVWYKGIEPLYLFEKRLRQYEKNLEKYNTWYEKNEDKIKQELKRRNNG